MSKEDQKAASDRIMAKYPLTEEELEMYKRLTAKPGEYPVFHDKRVCGVCGAEFRDTVNQKGEIEIPMLSKFTDHQKEHNPTPAQWAEAYRKIEASRQKTAT